MSTIELYVVEGDRQGETIAFDEGTTNISEAREAAQRLRGVLMARVFEYSDSELVEDYREGHNLDGTPVEPEPCDECGWHRWPEEHHDAHCSLNPANAVEARS